MARMEQGGALGSFERRVAPRALGHPLTAFVTARVDQHRLAEVSAEDLYRIAGQILAVPGIERTTTALAMRELVPHRVTPLLRHAATGRQPNGR
ncbi:hypothetical protein [Streptomyces sp. NPDC047061]|uniref:hypothetical protein n=1 Tax=Streptomyces sp. NPDC047061 TaxID=3154605 RepID=UPI0033D99CDA